MRFDDRLETVLRIDAGSDSGRAAIWRQLIDMLAQSGNSMTVAAASRGLAALAILRPDVPLEVRVATTRAVAARCNFAPLAAFLASDSPAVITELMDRLSLSDASWLALLPDLGPLGRSKLRRRAGLSVTVRRALHSFGTVDFALPSHAPDDHVQSQTLDEAQKLSPASPAKVQPNNIADNPSEDQQTNGEIAALVRRIEAYRSRRVTTPEGEYAGAAAADISNDPAPGLANGGALAFRSDTEGLIRIVSGGPRGKFVGLTLAEPARAADAGFDAGVARAFAKRAVIRAGRLLLVGDGLHTGHWLIDADPQFERLTGRFVGYEGVIKRPDFSQLRQPFEKIQEQPDATDVESAVPQRPYDGRDNTHDAAGVAISAMPMSPPVRPIAEGMRQMVHELRSPLNAINGFAQLIDGQYFGPVAMRYRELAQLIMADASMLGLAFDDLDIAARLDMGNIIPREGQCDFSETLRNAISTIIAPTGPRPVAIEIAGLDAWITTPIAQGDLKRILSRLLNALIQMVPPGEALSGSLSLNEHGDFGRLNLERPTSLMGVDISPAFDEAYRPAIVGDTSIIGFGPTLDLIHQLATLHGGALIITDDQFILNFPALSNDSDRVGSSG